MFRAPNSKVKILVHIHIEVSKTYTRMRTVKVQKLAYLDSKSETDVWKSKWMLSDLRRTRS